MTNDPKEGDTIAVWFSCGAASAVALKETIARYPQCTIRAVNNPVVEEGPDNRRFLQDVYNWLNIDIESASHPSYPECSAVEVWERNQYMSAPKGAPCTRLLKIGAREHWQKTNKVDHTVMGFPVGEESRHFDMAERGVELLPVLIDAGMSKADCYNVILEAGLRLPDAYLRGYPNANCIGCVKATSPTYWNHVRKADPDVFEHRAEQSRRLGAKLVRVNNVRIFLDELSPTAQGRPMKNMDFECGIFCQATPTRETSDERA